MKQKSHQAPPIYDLDAVLFTIILPDKFLPKEWEREKRGREREKKRTTRYFIRFVCVLLLCQCRLAGPAKQPAGRGRDWIIYSAPAFCDVHIARPIQIDATLRKSSATGNRQPARPAHYHHTSDESRHTHTKREYHM